jgi:ribonuclease HII
VNLFEFDNFYRSKYGKVAGLDEAGRGPLAGPVVAAAVILEKPIEGVFDSKKLSAGRREELFEKIKKLGKIGVGIATPEEIDVLNILNATRLAMERALTSLGEDVEYVIVDGRHLELSKTGTCVVKGDMKSLSIAAASIVAKVIRDRIMRSYAKKFPGYGFEHNFGYPTSEHKSAIKKLGVTTFHRLTFSGVLENIDLELLSKWVMGSVISQGRYDSILRKLRKLRRKG